MHCDAERSAVRARIPALVVACQETGHAAARREVVVLRERSAAEGWADLETLLWSAEIVWAVVNAPDEAAALVHAGEAAARRVGDPAFPAHVAALRAATRALPSHVGALMDDVAEVVDAARGPTAHPVVMVQALRNATVALDLVGLNELSDDLHDLVGHVVEAAGPDFGVGDPLHVGEDELHRLNRLEAVLVGVAQLCELGDLDTARRRLGPHRPALRALLDVPAERRTQATDLWCLWLAVRSLVGEEPPAREVERANRMARDRGAPYAALSEQLGVGPATDTPDALPSDLHSTFWLLVARRRERDGAPPADVAGAHEERAAVLARSRSDLQALVLDGARSAIRSRRLEIERRHLERESTTDELTELTNRRGFERRLDEIAGRPAGLLLVDLDDFKQANDVHGHATGDAILRRIGAALAAAAACEPGAIAARIGGDEFALLMTAADEDQARAFARRVRGAVLRLTWEDLTPGSRWDASVGWAWGPGDGELLRAADVAMYERKRDRRRRLGAEAERRRGPDEEEVPATYVLGTP